MIEWLRSLFDGDKAEREAVREKVDAAVDEALIEMQTARELRENGILADYIEAERTLPKRGHK